MNDKLAKSIYKLAWEIEDIFLSSEENDKIERATKQAEADVTKRKLASKYVRFTDDDGNSFMIPYDQIGSVTWLYSPYTRSKAQRDGVFNLTVPKVIDDSFTASVRTADKFVRYRDESGRAFILPFENVGTAMWAWSPFNRSRSKREDIFNVNLSGKTDDMFLSSDRTIGDKPFRVTQSEMNRADRSIPDFPFTIISRPQSDGGYVVVAVNPDTGKPVLKDAFEFADSKADIQKAVQMLNRKLDKHTQYSTKMTDTSRHR